MDPHITLLAPGRPKLSPEEAAQAFRILRLTIPSFIITSTRISVFERRQRSTVVLEVHPRGALNLLATQLIESCSWQDTSSTTKRPHIPHITLVNQLPRSRLNDVINSITLTDLPYKFECTSVTLFAKESRWPRWRELADWHLAKE
jgi:2'-5' RNA ligase